MYILDQSQYIELSTLKSYRGRRSRDRMIAGIRTTCATSAYHGEVYSIQYYVIKFVSDLRQIGVFSPVSFTNKTDRLAITVILLKVALNTITITPFSCYNVTLYTPNCVTEF